MDPKKMKMPELLAPAGSYEKLVTAIHYGADAVYLGGKQFSLRARAGNFDQAGIRRAVAYAHENDVRVYITINIFAHNQDLDNLRDYLCFLRDAGVDGLIISDPGILLIARETVPELEIHLSTQANVTNEASARFWVSQGVTRLNLARELGLDEINQIRQATDTELEVFFHGALCISYSGRCMLSNYFTGRDANQGDCSQPCRYSYKLVEEKRPGQYFPVVEDERGTYIFNSRDLCLLQRLPDLMAIGVDSLKIEGRMKSMGYVGAIVRLYRAALDWLGDQVAAGKAITSCTLPVYFSKELAKIGTRGWTENFIEGPPKSGDMQYDSSRTQQSWAPVGLVCTASPLLIEARNVLETGDQIEYLGKNMETIIVSVTSMTNEAGDQVERANPGNKVIIDTDPFLPSPEKGSIFRKKLR